MNRNLYIVISFVVLSSASVCACLLRTEPPIETVRTGNVEIELSADAHRPSLTFSKAGKKLCRVTFAEGGGPISEMKATRWLDGGIALAVEVDGKAGRRAYFWATLFPNAQADRSGARLIKLAQGKMLDDAEDHDIVGLVTRGDSLYVVLCRHEREPEESVSGYVYVNNCAITTGIAGELYRLDTEVLRKKL